MRNGCLRNKRVKSASLAALLGMLACCAVAAQGVDFVLDDLDGNQRRLSEFRGKWVLVNYWATWCPPCLEEMPELEMFHNRHKARDAVVLGVNMEQIEIGRLKAFVEEQFVSYPILLSEPRRSTELGEVPGLPTSYLVSPQGEVVARQVGAVTAEMLEAFLEQRSGGQK
jgi:thiol-disulfide isomerase/thioredoxin